MKYAIIKLQGKQYKVEENQQIVVDKLDDKMLSNDQLKIEDVLLVRDDEKILVGEPTVAKAVVTLSKVSDQRGPKIHVRTYKAKSRFRRHIGHRQEQTVLQVGKIALGK